VVDSSEGHSCFLGVSFLEGPGGCAYEPSRPNPHWAWQVFHLWSLHIGMGPIVQEAMETATSSVAILRLKLPKEMSLVSKKVFYSIRLSHTCIMIPN
jgi:hypothetical protein